MFLRIANIFRIGAREAAPLKNQPFEFLAAEASCILAMGLVNRIAESRNDAAVVEVRLHGDFPVDKRDLLALAEIGDDGVLCLRRHAKGHPSTRTAIVEPENEAGLFRR